MFCTCFGLILSISTGSNSGETESICVLSRLVPVFFNSLLGRIFALGDLRLLRLVLVLSPLDFGISGSVGRSWTAVFIEVALGEIMDI